MHEFIGVAEAAERLGITQDSVRDAIQRGEIVGGKVGGRYVVSAQSVEEYTPRSYAGRPGGPSGRARSVAAPEMPEWLVLENKLARALQEAACKMLAAGVNLASSREKEVGLFLACCLVDHVSSDGRLEFGIMPYSNMYDANDRAYAFNIRAELLAEGLTSWKGIESLIMEWADVQISRGAYKRLFSI